MTKVVPVICLQRSPREAHYFLNAISKSEEPDRLKVVKSVPEQGRFIYPVRYTPPSPTREGFEYFDLLPPTILQAIKEKRVSFLLDSSNERHHPSDGQLKLLHDKLDEMGIPLSSVTFLTQNTTFIADYKVWCEANNISKGFFVANHHYFLRELANYVNQTMIPSGEYEARRKQAFSGSPDQAPRGKRYLCLNFTPRAHRVALMLYLIKHDLLSKGHVSFSGLVGKKYDVSAKIEILLDRSPFPDIANLRSELPNLIEMGALTLDNLDVTPVIDIGQSWYYMDSYFSLVTESGIKPAGENCSFTEKPFKAVLGLHPFISMGIPNNLRELRRYGFQTFSPVIDETYDTVKDDTERMELLLGEFKRLTLSSDNEIKEMYASLIPQITHNFDYFSGGLQSMFRSDIEAPILEHLSRTLD